MEARILLGCVLDVWRLVLLAACLIWILWSEEGSRNFRGSARPSGLQSHCLVAGYLLLEFLLDQGGSLDQARWLHKVMKTLGRLSLLGRASVLDQFGSLDQARLDTHTPEGVDGYHVSIFVVCVF